MARKKIHDPETHHRKAVGESARKENLTSRLKPEKKPRKNKLKTKEQEKVWKASETMTRGTELGGRRTPCEMRSKLNRRPNSLKFGLRSPRSKLCCMSMLRIPVAFRQPDAQ
jgi:hypothetical protein